MTEQNKIISLGILAKKLGLSKSRLSYYDSIELIKPVDVMVGGGIRIYDEVETTKKIKQILKFQEEGLSLRQIKEEFN